MLYLEPTAQERLDFASIAYDSKKSCWCPHKKEGFVRATIVETKGPKVTCETEKGEVKILNRC